jgi:hypothetical protein
VADPINRLRAESERDSLEITPFARDILFEIAYVWDRLTMDHQLIIVRGRSVSGTIRLGDGVTTVGRHDDCQLRIKSSQVSRRHCELFEKKGLLLVKDLGSSNGTFVNGKKVVDQRVLEPGDELTVGQVTFKVQKAAAADAAPAAKPAAGAKPGDTAVVTAAAAATAAVDDDDFDIEFDEIDVPETIEPAVAVAESEPQAANPKRAAEAKAEPAPPASADDAVADFLLDIKFDEEG